MSAKYVVTFDEVTYNKVCAMVEAEVERCVDNFDNDNRDEWRAVQLDLEEVKLS